MSFTEVEQPTNSQIRLHFHPSRDTASYYPDTSIARDSYCVRIRHRPYDVLRVAT